MTTKSLSVVCVVSHTFLLNDYADPRHRFHSRRGGGDNSVGCIQFLLLLFSNSLQTDCPPFFQSLIKNSLRCMCQFGSKWFLKSRFVQTNNGVQYLQRTAFLNWYMQMMHVEIMAHCRPWDFSIGGGMISSHSVFRQGMGNR